MTLAEFERSQYIDRSLDKYFEENSKRQHSALDSYDTGYHPENWINTTTFILGTRDTAAGHLPYNKNSDTYKWNVEKSIDNQYMIKNRNHGHYEALGKIRISSYAIIFNTPLEKDNFTTFVYSKLGFRFISKLLVALNVDSQVAPNKFFPKVDWTRSWTVEEILADYGYTVEEIAEVMTDLENFKDMERD
jgi:hypothetical protein